MPRRPARPKDLSAPEFRAELKRLGFLRLSLQGSFCDIRAKNCPRTMPVMAGRRVNRRATLEALLADRRSRQAASDVAEAAQAERERIAATIAPVALTPPRDGLQGAAAIAALADDFIVLTTRSESAAFPELMRLGWRKTQLFEHADAARALAAQRQGGLAA